MPSSPNETDSRYQFGHCSEWNRLSGGIVSKVAFLAGFVLRLETGARWELSSLGRYQFADNDLITRYGKLK